MNRIVRILWFGLAVISLGAVILTVPELLFRSRGGGPPAPLEGVAHAIAVVVALVAGAILYVCQRNRPPDALKPSNVVGSLAYFVGLILVGYWVYRLTGDRIIELHVQTAAGEPISGAEIVVNHSRKGEGASDPFGTAEWHSVRTDAKGVATIHTNRRHITTGNVKHPNFSAIRFIRYSAGPNGTPNMLVLWQDPTGSFRGASTDDRYSCEVALVDRRKTSLTLYMPKHGMDESLPYQRAARSFSRER